MRTSLGTAIVAIGLLVALGDAAERSARRGDGHADDREHIANAVMHLEEARSSLCEAERIILDVGRSFGGDLLRVLKPSNAGGGTRLPRPCPCRLADPRKFENAFRDFERTFVTQLVSLMHSATSVDVWTRHIASSANESMYVNELLGTGQDFYDVAARLASLVRVHTSGNASTILLHVAPQIEPLSNIYARRDANFVALPIQRFWNETHVPLDDLVTAISTTSSQTLATRSMLEDMDTDRIVLRGLYRRTLDLSSSSYNLGKIVLMGAQRPWSKWVNMHVVQSDFAKLRDNLERWQILLSEIDYMEDLYKAAFDCLASADRHIDQSQFLTSLSLLVSDGAASNPAQPSRRKPPKRRRSCLQLEVPVSGTKQAKYYAVDRNAAVGSVAHANHADGNRQGPDKSCNGVVAQAGNQAHASPEYCSSDSSAGDVSPSKDSALPAPLPLGDTYLEADVLMFLDCVGARRHKDESIRNTVQQQIERLVQTIFPGSVVAPMLTPVDHLYMQAPFAGLDLTIHNPALQGDSLRYLLTLCETIIRVPDMFLTSATFVLHPLTKLVIRLRDNPMIVTVSCNVALSNMFAPMAFVNYPMMKPVLLYVWFFLVRHGLHDPSQGGIGWQLLQIMVVSHLQVNADDCQFPFYGHCLRSFFTYYGNRFDYTHQCISVAGDGRVFPKSGRGTTARHAFQFRLCAFSPDDPDADIGVDAYMIGAAIHLFKMASSLLMEYHPGLLLNADMVG